MVKRGIGMAAVIYFSLLSLMCGARCEVGLMGWRREMGFVACAAASRCFCAVARGSCAMRHHAAPLWPVGGRLQGVIIQESVTPLPQPRTGARDTSSITAEHRGHSGIVACQARIRFPPTVLKGLLSYCKILDVERLHVLN